MLDCFELSFLEWKSFADGVTVLAEDAPTLADDVCVLTDDIRVLTDDIPALADDMPVIADDIPVLADGVTVLSDVLSNALDKKSFFVTGISGTSGVTSACDVPRAWFIAVGIRRGALGGSAVLSILSWFTSRLSFNIEALMDEKGSTRLLDVSGVLPCIIALPPYCSSI